jgi:hypothetical protein
MKFYLIYKEFKTYYIIMANIYHNLGYTKEYSSPFCKIPTIGFPKFSLTFATISGSLK